MSTDQKQNSDSVAKIDLDSATERFRMHLRTRLAEMRANAKRIGASSTYIGALDRSADVVLTAIEAARTKDDAEKPQATVKDRASIA
jgi:hypothetical protein